MIERVLIIEDEPQAIKRLETLIVELIPRVTILARMDSVKESVRWLSENSPPDLIFMDIQLADGISFQIFEQCQVKSPVIFTTAYDAYALKAFKVNSIDYILKPVDKDELEGALKKLSSLTQRKDNATEMLANIGEAVRLLTRKYKTRFVLKVGEHLKSIEVSDIQYFFSLEKTTFAKISRWSQAHFRFYPRSIGGRSGSSAIFSYQPKVHHFCRGDSRYGELYQQPPKACPKGFRRF